MPGNYTHTTRASGTVLTANIYNSDHQNHVNNMTPDGVDDASADVTAMRQTADPGEQGSESLPISLRDEIKQLRHIIREIGGKTYWYQSPDYPVSGITGEIRMFGGTVAPTGWLLCDGAAVSRTTYSALFSVIGTTYGAGDGSTTFGLPDLRGRAPIGAGQGAGLTNRTLGQTVGAETHVLTQSETPLRTHSHGVNDPGHFHSSQASNSNGVASGIGRFGDAAAASIFTDQKQTGITIQLYDDPTADAHNNMQPSLAVNFIIKT